MSWDWTPDVRRKLQAFLANAGLVTNPLKITPIGDGHSNLTFLVDGGCEPIVVRRPPPPPLPPGGNDVLREAHLIKALQGTGVPVPKVLACGEVGEVFDVPFYVMNYLPGVVVTNQLPEFMSAPENCRAMGESLIDGLIKLHNVDWERQGLRGFGFPEGFNLRHLNRISRLVEGEGGVIHKEFSAIKIWLDQHVPEESGACIIHNDYRIGNVMWNNISQAKLLSVLDWELATIGDPLLDLAYFLCSYPESLADLTPTQSLATAVLATGFPSRAELASRYAERTGRNINQLFWYKVMVDWKLAVMYHYSKGKGRDPYYATPGMVESFLSSAWRTIQSVS